MLPPGSQVARFSGDRCREVNETLVSHGYIPQEPKSVSDLGLEFPFGGYRELDTQYSGQIVSITLQRVANDDWMLLVRPDTPLRTSVVSRSHPSVSTQAGLAMHCYEIAKHLHLRLSSLCSDLRWSRDFGSAQQSDSPEPYTP